MEILTKNQDITFITKFLLPLLTSENHIPVCLHPFDSIQNKFLVEGSYSKINKQKIEIVIESKILEEYSEYMELLKQKLQEQSSVDPKLKQLFNTHKFHLLSS